jgi:asparagine synthase (glutamine-hydrolysing)
MCGIAGYTGPAVPGRIEAMALAMAHRGPDGDGFFDADGVHLGMRRLSIVDLATGQQPKLSPDGQVVVVFNGEIYNHVELRRDLEARGHRFVSESSDTEVIVFLYEEYGLAGVDRIIGMFAIALYDRRLGRLFLIRDRFGKKPIYYRHDPSTGRLEFASEFNVIDVDARHDHIDHASLAWYFSQKAMPADRTIDDRIRKVPAGSLLRCELADGTCEVVRYYAGPASCRSSAQVTVEQEASDRIEALLTDSVRLRMRADVEVGAFLSGGVDSSLIVALASKLTDKPLKTYCLVYEQEINDKGRDRDLARLVSERFGTRHREVVLTPALLMAELPAIVAQYGQPNSAVIANWFISREMGRELKVALSGDGADELFGSYFLHRTASALDAYRRTRDPAVLSALPEAEAAFVRDAADESFARVVDRFGVFTDAELTALLSPRRYRPGSVLQMIAERERSLTCVDPLNRMLEFDCQNLLCDQILNYSDMLSMAHSLEVRTPFLDHRLVEYAFTLDPALKIRNGVTKYILKRVAARHLPEALVTRRKEGFVEPAVYWIADEMKAFCLSYLEAAGFNRLGLLNAAYVREVVARFYRDREFHIAKKVWSLLMYAIWERSLAD